MKKLGIIGAMEEEVARLKEHMTEVAVTERASLTFYEGKLNGLPVVVVRSGIGKVNAALCTQQLVDLFGIDAVINTGIAGSLNAKIDIGDIVLSTDALEHDMDAVVLANFATEHAPFAVKALEKGFHVGIVEGDRMNFKITTEFDMVFAELLMQNQNKE